MKFKSRGQLLILLLLCSCSQTKIKGDNRKKFTEQVNCSYPTDLKARHLAISANSKIQRLKSCIRNYLKFEKNKDQDLRFCVYARVSTEGKVLKAKVYNHSVKNLSPNGLAMCIEQEMWHMSFRGLHLSKITYVNFPLKILTSSL